MRMEVAERDAAVGALNLGVRPVVDAEILDYRLVMGGRRRDESGCCLAGKWVQDGAPRRSREGQTAAGGCFRPLHRAPPMFWPPRFISVIAA